MKDKELKKRKVINKRIIKKISLLGQQGERLLRQAIVDKDSYVATCALVSAYRLTHVSQQNNEIVFFPPLSFFFPFYF